MVLKKSGECCLLTLRGATSLDVSNIIWGEPSGRDVLSIHIASYGPTKSCM